MSSRGEKIDGGVRTHVHGFVPPVADLLEVKLDRLELAKASEALGVDVGLVHEHVPLAVVAREEACAVGKKTTRDCSVTHLRTTKKSGRKNTRRVDARATGALAPPRTRRGRRGARRIGRVGVETCAIARALETPTGLGAAALGEARRVEINSRMPPSTHRNLSRR